ncbi:49ef5d49-0ce1-4247-8a97-3263fdb84ade [Sclerotinia trifoliorum]|uniref:49ef5d49-0ce1-4247-8a97-3263fdb84ade n=1 Tax=Sclerotinia trifoliorum TaxID=28548 RepID=A0A8H2VMQ3_9HELO|nr:49ef5d49-0ce1-4247-8a97-3263fdb84ade [Sclerotinia trifoliorum]
MSRAAKLTLLGTSLFAASTIVFVHYAQNAEKAAMHAGVIRDMEQQRIKKERQLDFDMQRAMEEEYRKVQKVSDGTPR